MSKSPASIEVVIGLNAVVVAVTEEEPRVLVVRNGNKDGADGMDDALPSGHFHPMEHRTLEIGLRTWVEEQTRQELGYVEQLYTFGDRGRDPREQKGGPRSISVGYLALAREANRATTGDAAWLNWYRYFPWEDWRNGKPEVIEKTIEPGLKQWVKADDARAEQQDRRVRAGITFGINAAAWNEELVLERYELLYEAGLIAESFRDRQESPPNGDWKRLPGQAMMQDHRRILATGMGRLRGKIKYRPVIFELMAPTFTLFQLQRAVEGMAGLRLHKQNFRRLVEKNGLVEGTGRMASATGGRPAELFKFRAEVLMERRPLGVKLPASRKRV
ncbi:MAG: hypothetical protein OEY85_04970 [Rhodospirillales bacterium]|nr:hypothetical protein [Rhodospirillales bacterium]